MTARNIRAVRRRLGLSQKELAHRLGVARATVTRWENGSRRPPKIADLALQSALEGSDGRPWQDLARAALNELWDNAEDAIYDQWRERYRPQAR